MRMTVHRNGGATGQHSKTSGSKSHGKTPSKHKKATKKTASGGTSALSKQDAQFGQLVQQVAGALLNEGFAGLLVQAMERMLTAAQGENPGKLIAGTVSNATGAISSGGGDVTTAMVYLNGSTMPTPVYVPPHLVADVAPGCEVWVRAANGNRADLIIDSVRAFTGTPSSSTYLTGSSALNPANMSAGALAAGVLLAMSQLTDTWTTLAGTTLGTIYYSQPLRASGGTKLFVAFLSGYENTTATPQRTDMPVAFQQGCFAFQSGISTISVKDAASADITVTEATLGTGTAGGSANTRTGLGFSTINHIAGAVHHLNWPASMASAQTGVVVLLGF